jgi:hypothetical protein
MVTKKEKQLGNEVDRKLANDSQNEDKENMSSLPLIIIFERHWDVVPRSCIKKLVPHLAKCGYDTLCYEFPQDETAQEIRRHINSQIQRTTQINDEVEELCGVKNLNQQDTDSITNHLSRSNLSRERCQQIARLIKNLPAFKIQQETIEMAVSQLKFSVKGIDLDAAESRALATASSQEHLNLALIDVEKKRIGVMSNNLVKLAQKAKGVVLGCGIVHAAELLAELDRSGINTPVLYYFIHSQHPYKKGVDDVRTFINKNDAIQKDVLKDHTFCLLENQIDDFVERITAQVQEKISAHKELKSNSSRLENSSLVLRPTETIALKKVQPSASSLNTSKVSTVAVVVFLLIGCWVANYLFYPKSSQ